MKTKVTASLVVWGAWLVVMALIVGFHAVGWLRPEESDPFLKVSAGAVVIAMLASFALPGKRKRT